MRRPAPPITSGSERCIMQTATTETHTIFEAIARWVKNYRTALGTCRELAQCDAQDVAAIAQDLMVTPEELKILASKGPDSARLLYKMLAALGVDAAALSQRGLFVLCVFVCFCVFFLFFVFCAFLL